MKLHYIYRLFSSVLVAVFFVLFTSCSTSVSVVAENDMSGTVRLQTEVSGSVQSIMENFFGTETGTTLFNESKIRSSFAKSNLSVKSISFPSATGMDLTAVTNKLQGIIPTSADFITMKEKKGAQILTVKLSPENIQKAVTLMPEDASVYIDLLMAPVFTGENMSREEYIELISTAYGNDVADDLKKAVTKLSFTVPGRVVSSSLSNGSMGTIEVKDHMVILTIPLISLLTATTSTECIINCIQ